MCQLQSSFTYTSYWLFILSDPRQRHHCPKWDVQASILQKRRCGVWVFEISPSSKVFGVVSFFFCVWFWVFFVFFFSTMGGRTEWDGQCLAKKQKRSTITILMDKIWKCFSKAVALLRLCFFLDPRACLHITVGSSWVTIDSYIQFLVLFFLSFFFFLFFFLFLCLTYLEYCTSE